MNKKQHYRNLLADLIHTYMLNYCLDKSDIRSILKMSTVKFDELLDGTSTMSFDNLVKLSLAFGVEPHEFLDKNFGFLNINKLPLETQKLINNRKLKAKTGKVDTISSELDRQIEEGELNYPTTSKILFHKMPPSVTANKKSSEVTKLFKTGKRHNVTSFKFKKKSPTVFIHIDFIEKFKNIPEEEVFKKINDIEKEIDRENEGNTINE